MNHEPVRVESLRAAGFRCARISQLLTPVINDFLDSESLAADAIESGEGVKAKMALLAGAGEWLQQLEGNSILLEDIETAERDKICQMLSHISDFVEELRDGTFKSEETIKKLAQAYPKWSPESDSKRIILVFRNAVAKLTNRMQDVATKGIDVDQVIASEDFQTEASRMIERVMSTRNDSGIPGPVGRKLNNDQLDQLRSLADGRGFRFQPNNLFQIMLDNGNGLDFGITSTGASSALLLSCIVVDGKMHEVSLDSANVRLRDIRGRIIEPTLSPLGGSKVDGLIPKERYTILLG